MGEMKFTKETMLRIADLIEAVHDLYEELQAAVDLWEMDDEANDPSTDAYLWLHRARIALAKARGESQ